MKRLIILLILSVFLCFSNVFALTINADSSMSHFGDTYYDTGAEALTLTHTGNLQPDLTAEVLLTLAGWESTNKFGFYDFDVLADGTIVLNDMLEVFNGVVETDSDPWDDQTTIRFDITNGTAEVVGDESTRVIMDTTFGLYIDSTGAGASNDGLFYSHSMLNANGSDYFWIYDVSAVSNYFLGSDVVIAMEDQIIGQGVDADHNDLVLGIDDALPAPVPEPATVLLMGMGLIGLAGASRKKLLKK